MLKKLTVISLSLLLILSIFTAPSASGPEIGLLQQLIAIASTIGSAVQGAAKVADGWTSTLATLINTNLDAAISSRAPASTAVSNADLTTSRIQKLDNIKGLPALKAATNSVVLQNYYHVGTDYAYYFNDNSLQAITADKMNGYRVAMSNETSGNTVDVVNVSGSGWLYGVALLNDSVTSYSGQLTLIVDGVTVVDTGYSSFSHSASRLIIGVTGKDPNGTNTHLLLSPIPMRFETSLHVTRKAQNTSGGNIWSDVVYLLD